MGRLIKDDRLKPGGLSGNEIFEVQDVDGIPYLTTIAAMLSQVGPSEFVLTDGEGTTANGTAPDLGGTFSSAITIEGGADEFTIRTTNGTLVKYLQLRAPEDNILLSVNDTDQQGYITLTPDSVSSFFYNSGAGVGGSIEGTVSRITINSYDGSNSNDFKVEPDGIVMSNLKSGATQVAAGAAVNDLWVTNTHATLPDGVVMIGI